MDYDMDSPGAGTSQESGMTMTPSNRKEIPYFAYGSNMSTTQMLERCPSSTVIGLAYLHGYEWLINERGYANIARVPNVARRLQLLAGAAAVSSPLGTVEAVAQGRGQSTMEAEVVEIADDELPGVYGVAFLLPEEDERNLDRYEGVPEAYEKKVMEVELDDGAATEDESDEDNEADVVNALVYINQHQTTPSQPRDEYIGRMNRAIHEARLMFGLPEWYIDKVLRRYIPAPAEEALARVTE